MSFMNTFREQLTLIPGLRIFGIQCIPAWALLTGGLGKAMI